MHIKKQQRRERALERFSVQTREQWNNGRKGDKQVAGSYEDYLARKEQEKKSLAA